MSQLDDPAFCSFSDTHIAEAESVIAEADLVDPNLAAALNTKHWMNNLSASLLNVLLKFPPGTVLKDCQYRHWVRRAKMAITRHRFLRPVGDDLERFYEQKYLLCTPLVYNDDVVQNPPRSWLEFCVEQVLCDSHQDAMSTLHSPCLVASTLIQLRNWPNYLLTMTSLPKMKQTLL